MSFRKALESRIKGGGFPPVWIPESEGEELVGKVVKIRDGRYSKVWDIQLIDASLDPPKILKDIVTTPSHRALVRELESQEVIETDVVIIRYIGERKTKRGGRPVKLYEVGKMSWSEFQRFLRKEKPLEEYKPPPPEKPPEFEPLRKYMRSLMRIKPEGVRVDELEDLLHMRGFDVSIRKVLDVCSDFLYLDVDTIKMKG